MIARIEDGYTRHVAVGDDVNLPRVEFSYRVPRGADLQEHIYDLARCKDKQAATNYQNEAMANRIASWQAEGFDVAPTSEDIANLDAHLWMKINAVLFDGAAPDEVLDRPEVLNGADQSEADAKN